MSVELEDAENRFDSGREIRILIFCRQTGKVLLDTTSTALKIPGASGRSNNLLQETLERILRSEPHESVLKDTVIDRGVEYFFIDGSTLEENEGYSWTPFLKSTTALKNASVEFEVFFKLLDFLGFDWPKVREL